MRGVWKVTTAVAVLGVLAYSQGVLPASVDAKIDGVASAVAETISPTIPQTSSTAIAAHPSEYVVTATGADGKPGGWSTCTPINIIVNLEGAPAGALDDVKAAVERLRSATGLDFNLAGVTAIRPNATWGQKQEGDIDGWAPVLLAWAPESSGLLTVDGASALATPVWVNVDGHAQFVSGQIVFNSDHNTRYQPGFAAGVLSLGSLVEHELGHIAGLDHVDSPAELMYPEMGHAGEYAAGDLAGLTAVATNTGCLPEPATAW